MKTPFHSSSALPRRWAGLALAACAVTAAALHAPDAAAAGQQQCTNSAMQAEGPWNITTNFAGIANGVSIADITYSHSVTATNTLINYVMGLTVETPGATGPYQTVPLLTFPGLGLRWSWAGYDNISNAQVNTSALRPVGSVVTAFGREWIAAPFTTNVPTKQFRVRWKLELVVTDIRAYAGGVGNFNNESGLRGMRVTPSIKDNVAPVVLQACSPVFSNLAQALAAGGALALPELPKPPTPTCQFPVASLNQSVPLNRGTTGSVPANGAGRAEGAVGETPFFINAVNCGADSNYALYFTDANQAGGNKEYLNSTGAQAGKVNLRMYSAGSTVPVQFGPPAVGGSQPAYAAGVTNSGTAAGSSFNHPLTVQYVRAPGYVGPLTADSLAAQATVTVVYP
ncbi:fimbrial protein [Comamonas testosteroni]|uniref:fimbrial protein n=1 Tax=Comamonas testosteroni TaxID=285 RepID=UPI00389981B4